MRLSTGRSCLHLRPVDQRGPMTIRGTGDPSETGQRWMITSCDGSFRTRHPNRWMIASSINTAPLSSQTVPYRQPPVWLA
jgi:hypothetical protein